MPSKSLLNVFLFSYTEKPFLISDPVPLVSQSISDGRQPHRGSMNHWRKVDVTTCVMCRSLCFKIKVRQNERSKEKIAAYQFVASETCCAMLSVSAPDFHCAPKWQAVPLGGEPAGLRKWGAGQELMKSQPADGILFIWMALKELSR